MREISSMPGMAESLRALRISSQKSIASSVGIMYPCMTCSGYPVRSMCRRAMARHVPPTA